MVRSPFLDALLALVLLSSSAFAECDNMPETVKNYLNRNPHWSLVGMKDLVPDDRQIWRQYHKDLCPGFASVNFDAQKAPYFVLALLKKDKEHSLEKLIAIPPRTGHATKDILLTIDRAARTSVIWRAGPGRYEDVVTGRQITLRHDAVVYEVMEAGAMTYYLSHGRFKHIQNSE